MGRIAAEWIVDCGRESARVDINERGGGLPICPHPVARPKDSMAAFTKFAAQKCRLSAHTLFIRTTQRPSK
jgi:hypothetical protein